jgi:hypothetical protein
MPESPTSAVDRIEEAILLLTNNQHALHESQSRMASQINDIFQKNSHP